MTRYPNGEIPDSELVTFDFGHDDVEGDWKHQLTPGTYAKHLALVARAKDRTGRTLRVSPGSNAYRPIRTQRIFRDLYGNGAAVPGTSSHGGQWEGADRMAMDYGNWAYVYAEFANPRAEFFADCRAVGLEPGLISTSRGYPDEPWHVIDNDPWAPAPASATSPEEDIMKDAILTRWNGLHVLAIGRECVYHVPDPGQHARAEVFLGKTIEVDNDGLTTALLLAGVHWEAVDAVLRGAAYGSNGKYWSRQTAEGIAIRGGQAAASKTLADVLATAKKLEKA